MREGEGIAAKALQNLGLSFEQIQQTVEKMVAPSGGTLTIGEIPFTPRAKRVLELSVEEARLLGQGYIGTEHLLLGLIGESEGVAGRVLVELGAEPNRVREETLKLLGVVQDPGPALVSSKLRAVMSSPGERVEALTRILIRRGIITEEEMAEELKRLG